jgi:hypothetical protein
MRFRSLTAFAAAVAVALALAAPAGAARGGGVKGLFKDLEFSAPCSGGTVSYTWSGFHGVHDAVVDVTTNNGARLSFNTVKANGSGSFGPVSFNVLQGTFTYDATAYLETSKGQIIAQSEVQQSIGPLTC